MDQSVLNSQTKNQWISIWASNKIKVSILNVTQRKGFNAINIEVQIYSEEIMWMVITMSPSVSIVYEGV